MKASHLIPLLLLIGGMVYSCNSKDEEPDKLKSILADTVATELESSSGFVAGMASISKVGSKEEPISVVFVWRDDKQEYDDCSYQIERMPVSPGGIMQTVTLTYYLDKGRITPDKQLPTNHGVLPELMNCSNAWPDDVHIKDYELMYGRDSISIREGFLMSSRYVTDRYVLDDMNMLKNYWARSSFHGFIEQLTDYLGTSPAYYRPHYYYVDYLKRNTTGIADGRDILISQKQILNFYGSIANNGINPWHSLVTKKRICSEETANAIKALLRENVLNGTGVRLRDCSAPVAGKTGYGELDKGRIPFYGSIEDHGTLRTNSFVGFFPYDNPQYTLSITYYLDSEVMSSLSQTTFKKIVDKMMEENLL